MSYAGWLYFVDDDGTTCEIINHQRLINAIGATAACGTANISIKREDCEWSNGVLPYALNPCSVDEDGESTWAPMTFAEPTWDGNPAPWWDGVDGSPSSQAYGFWVEEWTGLDGAHHKRGVAPRAGRRGGANFGSISSGHRVWAMNIVLVAGSGPGLESLMRWLEATLLDCCNPCGGNDMLVRTVCPPDGDPEFGLYKVKGAALLTGPKWETPPIESLGCVMRRVSIEIGVSDPCLYSCAVSCANEEALPEINYCIPFSTWFGCNNECQDFADFRLCCPVPAALYGTVSPVVTIQNDSTKDSVPMRIYGMSDPLGLGCDPCTLPVCQDVRTHSIPGGGTLLVDAATRKVLYKHATTGGEWIDGTAFLDPDPGTVPQFLQLSCDEGWVAIEPSAFCGETAGLKISVDIIQRVGCC